MSSTPRETSPSPHAAHAALHHRTRFKLRERWQTWIPWSLMHVRRSHRDGSTTETPAESLESIRLLHSERYVSMSRQGIDDRVIVRNNLDDPRLTPSEWQRRVQAHLKLKRSRRRFRPKGESPDTSTIE